jgi:hypothetical protein
MAPKLYKDFEEKSELAYKEYIKKIGSRIITDSK